MSELQDFEYIPQIEDTEANARAVQTLTLQDLIAGGFKYPTNLADPDDYDHVSGQRGKLYRHPERYSGYQQRESGLIVAYMKAGEWLADDEAPFAAVNLFSRMSLIRARMLRGGSLNPKTYGVFGLVASESLDSDERYQMLNNLLFSAMGRAAAVSASVVNVVTSSQDLVTSVATDLGFIPKGRRGEAAGAPGLVQQRYQRPVDSKNDNLGF